MKDLIILFVFTLSADFVHGQNWINTSLNDRVSVSFPSKPEVQEFSNVTLYHVADSQYVINVSVSDISRSDVKFTQDSIRNLSRRIIESRIKATFNGKIIGERKITLERYEGLGIDYTHFFDGLNDVPSTTGIILIGSTLFSFDIFDLKKRGLESLRKEFLNSIQIK